MKKYSKLRIDRSTIRPISLFDIKDINNQNIVELFELFNNKHKGIDAIHTLSHHLQQVLELSYFNQLKSTLNEADYNIVIQKLAIAGVKKGEVIIDKNRRNDYFYILLYGEVQILDEIDSNNNLNDSSERKFEVINKLSAGDTFGQSSLISDKRETTARVQAKTKSVLLLINYEIFARTAMKIILIKKQDIANILQNSSLFYNIDLNSIRDLAAQVNQIKYRLNQSIFVPGSVHESIYFIKTGTVQLSQNSVKLMTLTIGQSFGIQYLDLSQISPIRQQQAKAKTNDVIIYKISFSRFKILKESYDQFVKNIRSDFMSKRRIHQSLRTNYYKVQKLLTCSKSFSTTRRSSNKRISRMKTKMIQSIPEWWGTASKTPDSKLIKYRVITSQITKQNKLVKSNSANSGLLGIKRINQLKKVINFHKTETNQIQETLYQASLRKKYQPVILKQIMNKIVSNESAQVMRRKVVPKLKKQKLLNYAKSFGRGCQLMIL